MAGSGGGAPGMASHPFDRGPAGLAGPAQRPSRLRNGPVGLGLDGLPGTTRGPCAGASAARRHGQTWAEPSTRRPERAWDTPFRLRLAHMDWLTFIDHLIGHLAWPLVVAGLVIFLSLRHRVAFDTLLHRVRKARAGPFEAELDEAKAEADAAGLPPPSTKPPPDTEVLQRPESNDPEVWFGYFLKLAEQDPLGAVHGSYRFCTATWPTPPTGSIHERV